MELSNEKKRKLAATQYIVKATHDESFFLWCLYASDSPYQRKRDDVKFEWKQDNLGFMYQLGETDGMPVMASGFWADIDGKRVLFIELTSMVADYRLLDPFLKEYCPYAERTTDAMNFPAW